MTTKLTLSIEKETIDKAKKVAKLKNKSLSKMIEDYLNEIISNQNDIPIKKKLPPISKELSGILKNFNINYDNKEMASYLEKKYK